MKKTVQIFIQEDYKEELIDQGVLDEVNEIKRELSLLCGNQKSDKSSIPYLWLDSYTENCFKVLCPRVDKLNEYTGQIPLEVLKAAKQSISESHFDWMEVWSNEKDPDPFLVGRVYNNQEARDKEYTWNSKSYLIARWGDEKMEVSKLIDKAIGIASKALELKVSALESKVIGALNFMKINSSIVVEEDLKKRKFSASEIIKDELNIRYD